MRDIEIARAAALKPISAIADEPGISLTTVSSSPAGEDKTTTNVLVEGLL